MGPVSASTIEKRADQLDVDSRQVVEDFAEPAQKLVEIILHHSTDGIAYEAVASTGGSKNRSNDVPGADFAIFTGRYQDLVPVVFHLRLL